MAALGPLLGSFRDLATETSRDVVVYDWRRSAGLSLVPSVFRLNRPRVVLGLRRASSDISACLALLRADHPDVRHDDDGRVESPLS